jgi:acetyl-CoA carboxylase biotin carboxyl carrier protein
MKPENGISFEDLIQIVQLIESSSHFRELHLKVGEVEIDLLRKADGEDRGAAREMTAASAPAQGGEVSEAIDVGVLEEERGAARGLGIPAGSVVVRSPTIGTFYRAPSPDAEPYVSVGSCVERDTIVCIIEVMKLMSSITAGANGVVTHILVDDAQLVQAEEPLIFIKPED